MTEQIPSPSPAAGLAQRLAAAASATGERRGPGRCAAPVAVDDAGVVVERCPARPRHPGEHEIESETARRERLGQAAQIEPWRVGDAVEGVLRWLNPADGAGAPRSVPLANLWTLVEVAEAAAAGSEYGEPGPRGVR